MFNLIFVNDWIRIADLWCRYLVSGRYSLFLSFQHQRRLPSGNRILNGTTRPLFRFIFSSSRQIMQFYNKIMWRVSIQRWESNWPSDYESPPLTTRPGPRPSFLTGWLLTWSCSYGSEAFDWEVIGILVFCYQTDFFAVISCKKCAKNKRNSGPDSTYLKKALWSSLEPKSSTNLTIPCLVCISL